MSSTFSFSSHFPFHDSQVLKIAVSSGRNSYFQKIRSHVSDVLPGPSPSRFLELSGVPRGPQNDLPSHPGSPPMTHRATRKCPGNLREWPRDLQRNPKRDSKGPPRDPGGPKGTPRDLQALKKPLQAPRRPLRGSHEPPPRPLTC